MTIPTDRRYLRTHEWHRRDGDVVTVGITQHAADELTDITYVSLPSIGRTLSANAPFGEIESVKATSDLYSGVSGEVVETNDALTADPSLVNSDPHEAGWMIRVRPSDPAEYDKLLDPEAYRDATGQ